MSERQRPSGVNVLTGLQGITGIYLLLAGFAIVGLANVAAPDRTVSGEALAGSLGIGIGVLSLALAIAALVFCWQLWQLKHSAWTGALVSQVLTIIISIIEVILGAKFGFISLLLAAVSIYYLLRPSVKATFGK
ncbi:MAG: hypothetical protein KME26_12810 [Oscillatoria princeps RMCB-10]|nr:hypothetical protein [Oscillatoria princeps RMCB-10]